MDGKRIEAMKHAHKVSRCVCQHCGNEMIAKCGERAMHHWAHRTKLGCDKWRENETAWHRDWKNRFPEECQEVKCISEETGKWHIADIRTPNGMVVEVQHSYLAPYKVAERTEFYKNNVGGIWWVIDATIGGVKRMQGLPNIRGFEQIRNPKLRDRSSSAGVQIIRDPLRAKCLNGWVKLGVPVAFDFGSEDVWIVIGVHVDGLTQLEKAYGYFYPKTNLVEDIMSGAASDMKSVLELAPMGTGKVNAYIKGIFLSSFERGISG